MGKCLVTKLSGVSSNNDLLHIGELRIGVNKKSALSENRSIDFQFSKPTTANILGDGYFTDKTYTENKGKETAFVEQPGTDHTLVYLSDGAYNVSVKDKYSMKTLLVNIPCALTLEDLMYSKELERLHLSSDNVIGNIDSLQNMKNLYQLSLNSNNISGSFESIKALGKLAFLNFNCPNVNADVTFFKDLTELVSCIITNATGDISSLGNLSKMEYFALKNSSLTGDLSVIKGKYAEFSGNASSFSWTNRTSDNKILAIAGFPYLGNNVDKMLQDQANCVKGFSDSDDTKFKTITVKGTKTSASDAAVQTLQSKGYTVSITPA